jgi:hypothetical protein
MVHWRNPTISNRRKFMNIQQRSASIAIPRPGEWLASFVFGFIAVLAFHQPMVGLLASMGITQGAPYATKATSPFGVPQFLSGAFWGGLWGMVLCLVSRRWALTPSFLVRALLFGMLGLSLVAWFVVAPLKGLPVAAGGKFTGMLTSLCANAAWGFGAGLLLWLYRRRRAHRSM